MVNYMMAFVLTFGLLIVGVSTPAAGGTPDCGDACNDLCQTCEFASDTCTDDGCPSECVCTDNTFTSRGECVSTLIAEECSGLRGKGRAACNHDQQDICDCIVDNACLAENGEE